MRTRNEEKLLKAILNHDVEQVRTLLSMSTSPHMIADNSPEDVANKIRVNTVRILIGTALARPISSQAQIDIVTLLLNAGGDVNCNTQHPSVENDTPYKTPLDCALLANDGARPQQYQIAMIELLLAR